MKDPRIIEILPLLKAPDDNVRLEAAKRLGELGTHEAMEALKITMNDENVAVRFYAKKAVKFIEQSLRVSGIQSASQVSFAASPSEMSTGASPTPAAPPPVAAPAPPMFAALPPVAAPSTAPGPSLPVSPAKPLAAVQQPDFPPLGASWNAGAEGTDPVSSVDEADASLPGLPPFVSPTPGSQLPPDDIDVNSLSSLAREVESPAVEFSAPTPPPPAPAAAPETPEKRSRKWKAKTTSAIIGGRLVRLGGKKKRGAEPRSDRPPMPGEPTYPGMPPQGIGLDGSYMPGTVQGGDPSPGSLPPSQVPGEDIEVFSSHLDAIFQDQANIAAAIAENEGASVPSQGSPQSTPPGPAHVPSPSDPYANAFASEAIPRVAVPAADPFADFMASLEEPDIPAVANPDLPPPHSTAGVSEPVGSTFTAFMMGQGGVGGQTVQAPSAPAVPQAISLPRAGEPTTPASASSSFPSAPPSPPPVPAPASAAFPSAPAPPPAPPQGQALSPPVSEPSPSAPMGEAIGEDEEARLVRVGRSILRPCVQLLFNGLDVGDPQVAVACAMALGKLGIQEAGARVVGLLQGGLIERDVILALGCFQDPRVVDLLRRLYLDGRFLSLRPAVAEALTQMQIPEAWEFLKEILRSQDVDQTVQNTIVRYIGDSGNAAFVDVLVQQLGAVEEYFEITVIQALGSFAATHPRVKQRLIAGLSAESNPRKASCFLSALAGCTDGTLVDDVEPYVRSRDRRVRSNAIELIAGLDVSDPVKLRILKPLLLDEDNRCRANACIALASIDEKAVHETLEKMLLDRNKWHRASGCYALGVLHPPSATGLLIRALRDPDTDVRINATKALREIQDPQVVQALSGITSDRNIWIRQYAIEALGNMGAPSAVTRLRAILRQESNSQVLSAALMALATCGDAEQSVKAIVSFLDHINDKVRLRAIEAFGQVMDGKSLNRLVPCLKDGDPRIRGAAVREIWKFGEFGIVATLHEMLSSYDSEDRRAAALALSLVGDVQRALRETEGVSRLIAALRRHPMYAKV